jgi:hypothetical protein
MPITPEEPRSRHDRSAPSRAMLFLSCEVRTSIDSPKVTYSCMIPAVSTSLVILGCGQRKRQTSHLLPAIDRYDGPVFRVLRKHAREVPENATGTCILSARFGLIPGTLPIPPYDHLLTHNDCSALRTRVDTQLKRTFQEIQPQRVFVSVGLRYWSLLEGPLTREVHRANLVVANGGIGGRASQLAHWLRPGQSCNDAISEIKCGEATLLGTTVRLSRAQVLRRAAEALLLSPVAARHFETWYVAVGHERVAPKWLVSLLFNKPVSRFRTADARRVLQQLGVETQYAH